jgi:hypothetical protein
MDKIQRNICKNFLSDPSVRWLNGSILAKGVIDGGFESVRSEVFFR